MIEMPSIRSDIAERMLKDNLDRTEKSLKYMNNEIERILAEVVNMCTEKARLEVHIESLKDALIKCQKQ